MSTAELRAHNIFRIYHLDNEKSEVRRNLIILLSADSASTIQKNADDDISEKSVPDLYSCFHGSWGEELSSEEYCSQLREGISAPKEIEAW